MFDNSIDPTDPTFFEVTRRLEAYADLRLSPSAAATTRIRMNVMHAAHRHAALIEAGGTVGLRGALSTTRSAVLGGRTRSPWRRPAASVLAAALTLGIVAGTVSAAKPGGPLYAARLSVEMSALPADPVARAHGEVSRLEERLREVRQASSEGDSSATEAALAAYSAIADEAEQASTGNAAASAAIEATVARHVAVLTLLVDSVPSTARSAIERALTSSTKVLDDIHAGGGTGGNGGDGNDTGQPGQPANGGQPADNGQPTVTTKPGKPAVTPRPEKPAATTQPGKPAASSQAPMPDKSADPARPGGGGGGSGHDGPPLDK